MSKGRKLVNLSGRKYGRILVIAKSHSDSYNRSYWWCECACGEYITVRGTHLNSGGIKSCGCLMREMVKGSNNGNYKHGKRYERIYTTYVHMMGRTTNINDFNFKHYGGRGIKVCNKWKNDFMSFYKWAMLNGYKDDLTIDRIDNNKGYFPVNCQWITHSENVAKRNKKYNRIYYGG